jgi:glucose/arabinose dehydrogenase
VQEAESAPTDVAAEEAAEADLMPTVTPQAVAAATGERVAAPTFDPAQNQVVLQPVLEGFDRPLFVTHANDGSGRIFVVEKEGSIRIVSGGVILEQRFLNITNQVTSSGNEQGLLGLAFAPNYSESGYFFVNYTDLSGNTAISRFQVDAANPDRADPNSEFMVLQIEDPARNHNGGMLAFGPDGNLWIGMGDGGGGGDTFGNGQNPNTLLGKMIRIDVTSDPSVPYVIPADNPWVEADWNGVDVLDEVWAVGLRNPWRYSFDRHTGDLWIADVGQNAYEEVNYTVAGTQGGLNYGWPIMEGLHCFRGSDCDQTGLELPVFEYEHANGCSVTGGYVYRGSQYPVLQGVYIFGDYCSGLVWATIPNPDGSWNTTQVAATGALLSSFGEDENGELYATDLNSGVIYQVTGE